MDERARPPAGTGIRTTPSRSATSRRNDRLWLGKVQLVAIYDLALTQAQIEQNFDAGVGKRLIMRFDVSAWAGAGSFIEFMVSEFDDVQLPVLPADLREPERRPASASRTCASR